MSPERLRELIAMTGLERRELARLLGYGSDNSLRQCERGKATLPADKAKWLEGYAKLRARHAEQIAKWLQKNPPPSENNG
jgi:transcriptional regulator with XRE-family HTH domain